MWTGLLGQEIPDAGDPEYAKQLIQESGEPMPTITYSLLAEPGRRQGGRRHQGVAREGRHEGQARTRSRQAPTTTTIFDDSRATELMNNGWGPDWPNASTVIPPIFTLKGGWDVSRVNDKAFNAKVDAALSETDRDASRPSCGRP